MRAIKFFELPSTLLVRTVDRTHMNGMLSLQGLHFYQARHGHATFAIRSTRMSNGKHLRQLEGYMAIGGRQFFITPALRKRRRMMSERAMLDQNLHEIFEVKRRVGMIDQGTQSN